MGPASLTGEIIVKSRLPVASALALAQLAEPATAQHRHMPDTQKPSICRWVRAVFSQ